ncbi:MAG: hypothetical protein K2K28_02290, partial [Clostridia bacterium]|nr:hypothetical protein [Clostridia bacterium]
MAYGVVGHCSLSLIFDFFLLESILASKNAIAEISASNIKISKKMWYVSLTKVSFAAAIIWCVSK